MKLGSAVFLVISQVSVSAWMSRPGMEKQLVPGVVSSGGVLDELGELSGLR